MSLEELAATQKAYVDRATQGDYAGMRRATVTATSPFTISMNGVDVVSPPRSPDYYPVVGDVVLVLMDGAAPYVLQSMVRNGGMGYTEEHGVGTLVGVAYDPTIHRLVHHSGTYVWSTGNPVLVGLPVTPAGYTGAWALNGDRPANAINVQGVGGYGPNSFNIYLSATLVSNWRGNFGCDYWTVR